MGVTGLWPILAPVKKHTALSSLQGQTVAVDLSIWVCENQAVRQMQSRVLKPHLRWNSYLSEASAWPSFPCSWKLTVFSTMLPLCNLPHPPTFPPNPGNSDVQPVQWFSPTESPKAHSLCHALASLLPFSFQSCLCISIGGEKHMKEHFRFRAFPYCAPRLGNYLLQTLR